LTVYQRKSILWRTKESSEEPRIASQLGQGIIYDKET
jgi:hypothetical protein